MLLAKRQENLFRAANLRRPGGNIIVEFEHSGDIDVLVVRQRTTQTSGYKTSAAQAISIVQAALALAVEVQNGAR